MAIGPLSARRRLPPRLSPPRPIALARRLSGSLRAPHDRHPLAADDVRRLAREPARTRPRRGTRGRRSASGSRRRRLTAYGCRRRAVRSRLVLHSNAARSSRAGRVPRPDCRVASSRSVRTCARSRSDSSGARGAVHGQSLESRGFLARRVSRPSTAMLPRSGTEAGRGDGSFRSPRPYLPGAQQSVSLLGTDKESVLVLRL